MPPINIPSIVASALRLSPSTPAHIALPVVVVANAPPPNSQHPANCAAMVVEGLFPSPMHLLHLNTHSLGREGGVDVVWMSPA